MTGWRAARRTCWGDKQERQRVGIATPLHATLLEVLGSEVSLTGEIRKGVMYVLYLGEGEETQPVTNWSLCATSAREGRRQAQWSNGAQPWADAPPAPSIFPECGGALRHRPIAGGRGWDWGPAVYDPQSFNLQQVPGLLSSHPSRWSSHTPGPRTRGGGAFLRMPMSRVERAG